MLLTTSLLTLFGNNSLTSGWTMLATVPIAVWELSVGCYLTFKGFRRDAVAALAS